jgi:zinc transport system substrate-binding protein
LVLILAACSGPRPAVEPAAKPVVYTMNYPLRYFAERLGGGFVDVRFPAPPGEDPAYWEPGPAVIQQYQQADLILLNGAGYDQWAAKATLPASRTVDTSASFKDRYIEVADLMTHAHGPEGEHSHGGTAFTTWLDPALAVAHAEAVAGALRRLLPPEARLDQNLAALRADLESLDAAMRAVMGDYRGAPLLASHPVYQYLARAYGWNLRELHWEPDEMPAAAEWNKLDALVRGHRAAWMIWEAPPAAGIRAELEKRGIGTAVFHPLGNSPEAGDYLTVMQENIERLRPVFRR